MSRFVLIALLLSALSLPVRASAQETRRADTYVDAQREKAANMTPPVETRGERIAALIERVGAPPIGWFPFVGSVYPGGWLALGPGYRQPFDNGAVVTGKLALSFRNFKAADVQMSAAPLAGGRLRIEGHAGWIDAPRLDHHGRGNDTRADDRQRYGLRPATAGARLHVTPAPHVTVDAGWSVAHYNARLRDESAGTPAVDVTLGAARLSAAADWRPSPDWANSGGMIRATWTGRRGLGRTERSFDEYEGEILQFIPILRGNWVVALRGLATVTTGDDIPFFLLPSVGGSTSRAYADFRFRDRQRLATSAELRWAPSLFVDLALFVDAARVAATRRELAFSEMHTSVGLGARFHTPLSTVLRLELAHGTEGVRFVVGGGPVF